MMPLSPEEIEGIREAYYNGDLDYIAKIADEYGLSGSIEEVIEEIERLPLDFLFQKEIDLGIIPKID